MNAYKVLRVVYNVDGTYILNISDFYIWFIYLPCI